MSRSDLLNALAALSEAGVHFVVVGVGGLNFYVPDREPPVATVDLDLLVEPSLPRLARAFAVLAKAGFQFEAGDEPFVDWRDEAVLGRLIGAGASVRAYLEGAFLDLMLSMSGFDFQELNEDAVTFEVAGVPIRVGRVEKLLRAKELAGRPKDREFLRAFAARFKPSKGSGEPRKRRRRTKRGKR